MGGRHYQIYTNDQATAAAEYRNLVVAYRNGAPVRLSDVAEVLDSVENVRNLGMSNGKPAVLVILYRQPGANIIDTVDRVKALLPVLQGLHPDRHRHHARDGPHGHDPRLAARPCELTLVVAITLVILVVFVFLRNGRATLIPAWRCRSRCSAPSARCTCSATASTTCRSWR